MPAAAPKYDGLFRARVTFDYAAVAEDELSLAKVRPRSHRGDDKGPVPALYADRRLSDCWCTKLSCVIMWDRTTSSL